MQDNIPSVVQVIPYEDYTVDVYFDDGKIVCYNAGRDMSPACLPVSATQRFFSAVVLS